MAKFEPSELSDLSRVRYVDSGATIRVLERRDKLGTPWYRVSALDPARVSVGEGWVNSTALIGQELRPASFDPIAQDDSYTVLGPVQDVSYATIKRYAIEIEMPLGRTKQQVESTLSRAASELHDRTSGDAIMVSAYMPGDDIENVGYTVGQAIYAPNGRWEDAGERADKRLSIEVGTVYFKMGDSPAAYSPGKRVLLRVRSIEDEVEICRDPNTWGDQEIIARVAAGTEAEILEHRITPITAERLVICMQHRARNFQMLEALMSYLRHRRGRPAEILSPRKRLSHCSKRLFTMSVTSAPRRRIYSGPPRRSWSRSSRLGTPPRSMILSSTRLASAYVCWSASGSRDEVV